jgi:hypothetical protein
MPAEEAAAVYWEPNNKSARDKMTFVRKEVARLVAEGQVIKVADTPKMTNPLSVAFKINSDGTVKRRLVIDLRAGWICFLNQILTGWYFKGISSSLSSSRILSICGIMCGDEDLGRVMRPVFRFLSCCGVRSMIYVNDGIVVAAEKARADEHYALTIGTFKKAGFTVAEEMSDAPGKSAQRKEYVSRFPDWHSEDDGRGAAAEVVSGQRDLNEVSGVKISQGPRSRKCGKKTCCLGSWNQL